MIKNKLKFPQSNASLDPSYFLILYKQYKNYTTVTANMNRHGTLPFN